MPDHTNALLGEWANIPTERIQNLMESLCRGLEVVTAAKGDQLNMNALDLEKGVINTPVAMYPHTFVI